VNELAAAGEFAPRRAQNKRFTLRGNGARPARTGNALPSEPTFSGRGVYRELPGIQTVARCENCRERRVLLAGDSAACANVRSQKSGARSQNGERPMRVACSRFRVWCFLLAARSLLLDEKPLPPSWHRSTSVLVLASMLAGKGATHSPPESLCSTKSYPSSTKSRRVSEKRDSALPTERLSPSARRQAAGSLKNETLQCNTVSSCFFSKDFRPHVGPNGVRPGASAAGPYKSTKSRRVSEKRDSALPAFKPNNGLNPRSG
jgi:hypothetical protein